MPDKVIWYISKYSSPKKYFMGSRHYSFSKVWNELGHRAIVFTSNSNHRILNLPKFDGLYLKEEHETVETIWLNGHGRTGEGGWTRLLSWLLFEYNFWRLPKKSFGKPDVIIASSLSLLSVWTGWYYARKYKAKFVFEVRDVWPKSLEVLSGTHPLHPFIQFLRLTERTGYHRADLVVGTMPNLKERVEEVNPKWGKKTVCVPQCYDEQFYESEQEMLDKGYVSTYLKSDLFTVAYAGTLSDNNPLDHLFAIAISDPEIRVLIAGYGKKLEEYKEQFKEHSNIVFVPRVRKAQIQHLLSYADVCFDSIDSELAIYGLSRNKWIDYMMAGKPIVCAMTGFGSMINEADSGYFVDFDNRRELHERILQLKNSPEECHRLGENGKRWLTENRSAQTVARQYLKFIFK